jgi:vacuolar protein sorting-associated protein 13A/C
MEDIGSVYLRLRKPDADRSMVLVRADLRIEGSTIFVNFFHANEGCPFTIENNTDYDATLCQTVPPYYPIYK